MSVESSLVITLEFAGGAELLFDKIKKRQVKLPQLSTWLNKADRNVWTINDLLKWMEKNLLKERPELFLQNDSVRPGILVLVNQEDWELCGGGEYELKSNDSILFISTLHGAQLLLFYLIFYSALASLFAISMKGLLSTIDLHAPKWTLDASRIGTNPGVGFRPISNNTDEGSLIWYTASNPAHVKKWTDLIDEYLEPYLKTGGPEQEVCDFDKGPGHGKVCQVDVRSWYPCTQRNNYSYTTSSPCIFIKVNRIYSWVPEVYNDPNSLPEDMPNDLKTHIAGLSPLKRNQIWISCTGEDPRDKELVPSDQMEYIPSRGLPIYYYPYQNDHGYLSPLVAVRLLRPPLHQIINLECRAWAKNIRYVGGHKDRRGSVHLEVMID